MKQVLLEFFGKIGTHFTKLGDNFAKNIAFVLTFIGIIAALFLIAVALEKIAQLENLEPSAEEIEAEYNRIAETYGMEVEEIKKVVTDDGIKLDVAVGKAVDFVKDNAVIK